MSRRNWALGGLALSAVAAAFIGSSTAHAQTMGEGDTGCRPVNYTIQGQRMQNCDGRIVPASTAPQGEVRRDFNESAPTHTPINSGGATVQRALITINQSDGSWRTPQVGEFDMRQVTYEEYAQSPRNSGQAGWNALVGEYADSCQEVGWQAGEAYAIVREAQRIGGNVQIRQSEVEAMFTDISRTSWGRRFLSGLGGVFSCLAGGILQGRWEYCAGAVSMIAGGELGQSSNDRQRRLDLRQRVDDVEMRQLDLRTRVLDGRMRLSWTRAMLVRGGCIQNQPQAVQAGFAEVQPFRVTRVNYTQTDRNNRGRNNPNPAPASERVEQPTWMTWSPGQP